MELLPSIPFEAILSHRDLLFANHPSHPMWNNATLFVFDAPMHVHMLYEQRMQVLKEVIPEDHSIVKVITTQ